MSEMFRVGDMVRIRTPHTSMFTEGFVGKIERLSECSDLSCVIDCNRHHLHFDDGTGWCPFRFEKINTSKRNNTSSSSLRHPNSKEFNRIIER